jgi:hypothetical protein
MVWLIQLQGQIVGLDTAPLITYDAHLVTIPNLNVLVLAAL